ncbi:44684_t:CDS:1, partial [Gigaspora margarita]
EPSGTQNSRNQRNSIPIWQAPSEEVAKFFDSATKAGISETGARESDNKTF